MHDKSYYGNNAELNCTWEEVCECECQAWIRHYPGTWRRGMKCFVPTLLFYKGPFWHFMSLQPDANSRGSYISNQCYFNKWWWNNLHSEPLLVTRLPPTMSTEEEEKSTEIIKSHSSGSIAAYKLCSCHLQGYLSLQFSCPPGMKHIRQFQS